MVPYSTDAELYLHGREGVRLQSLTHTYGRLRPEELSQVELHVDGVQRTRRIVHELLQDHDVEVHLDLQVLLDLALQLFHRTAAAHLSREITYLDL